MRQYPTAGAGIRKHPKPPVTTHGIISVIQVSALKGRLMPGHMWKAMTALFKHEADAPKVVVEGLPRKNMGEGVR